MLFSRLLRSCHTGRRRQDTGEPVHNKAFDAGLAGMVDMADSASAMPSFTTVRAYAGAAFDAAQSLGSAQLRAQVLLAASGLLELGLAEEDALLEHRAGCHA